MKKMNEIDTKSVNPTSTLVEKKKKMESKIITQNKKETNPSRVWQPAATNS